MTPPQTPGAQVTGGLSARRASDLAAHGRRCEYVLAGEVSVPPSLLPGEGEHSRK